MNIVFRLFTVLFCSAVLFVSCSKDEAPTSATNQTTDPESSKVKSDEAYQLVETEMGTMLNGNFTTLQQYDQLKFTSALSLFKQALDLNANNTDALFGAAVTQILSAYSDTAINSLVKDIDSSENLKSSTFGDLHNLLKMPSGSGSIQLSGSIAAAGTANNFLIALNDPPLANRIQRVLRDNLLPKVQSAIDYLSKIDTMKSFKFTISGKMQGDVSLQPVTVYPTEVSFLNSMLHFLKFNIMTILIYKYDLADYSQSTLLNALKQSNETFFVLQPDGKDRAATAKSEFSAAIVKAKQAINQLRNLSGSKSDAVIKLGNDGFRQRDLDTLTVYLNKAESALSGNYSIELKNADTDGNSYTITVNLSAFFSNPPQNPKKNLFPAYTLSAVGTKDIHFEYAAGSYSEFSFPDPTMGGLFPNMSQATLKRLLKIDNYFNFTLEGSLSSPALPFYSSGQFSGAVVKMVVNGTTYSATTDVWGWFKIIVRDATTTPQAISSMNVTLKGLNTIELQNISSQNFTGVQIKKSVYCPISVIPPPTELSVNVIKASRTSYVSLIWTVPNTPYYPDYYWQSGYVVQRKTNSTQYSNVSVTTNYQSSGFCALDYGFTSGVMYTYRIKTIPATSFPVNSSSPLYYVNKQEYYSNEVSIIP